MQLWSWSSWLSSASVFFSPVLVQLWAGEKPSVWSLQSSSLNLCHQLYVRGHLRSCEYALNQLVHLGRGVMFTTGVIPHQVLWVHWHTSLWNYIFLLSPFSALFSDHNDIENTSTSYFLSSFFSYAICLLFFMLMCILSVNITQNSVLNWPETKHVFYGVMVTLL